MARLLVIDDEPNVRYALERYLSSDVLEVTTVATAHEGLREVRDNQPDAVVLDVRLPDMSGLELHGRIRKLDPRLPVIVITAFAKTETAIEATRNGAFEYLLKPVDFRRLRDVVAQAVEVGRLNHVPAVLDGAERALDASSDPIVGCSPAMQEVYKAIGRVAPQDTTVLILGESGTGKELVARAIFHYGRRSQAPFLAINCAALPENLLESELFGHERGAFTGADARRIGKFEQLDGGTIFLDEIGDMTPATQAKVLRLLQRQSFERVGGNQSIKTDVRVIAATNQNLPTMVETGRFRQDLFYRLNGFTIGLPPLRRRGDDLTLLTEHFLRLFNRDLHKNIRRLTPEAQAALGAYDWPGNVRELESAVRYAMLNTVGEVLTADSLPESCRPRRLEPADEYSSPTVDSPSSVQVSVARPSSGKPPDAAAARGNSSPEHSSAGPPLEVVQLIRRLLDAGQPDIYRRVSTAVDTVVLEEVLKHVGGNQMQAAELLGISRTTLRAKLRALDFTFCKQVVPGGAREPPPSESS